MTARKVQTGGGPTGSAGTRCGSAVRGIHDIHDDRGAGTVLVLALVGVVVVLVLGTAALVGAVVTRGAAQSAADLSALAAAAALQRGASDPCARAGAVAERNGVRLDACRCAADSSCTVTTSAETRTGAAARATARAGPASLAGLG